MGILGNSTVQNRAAVEAALASATNEDALPYLVYSALLTQEGTSAPTSIVLENTLGFSPTFSYSSTGNYDIIGFPETVWIMIKPSEFRDTLITAYWNGSNQIRVMSVNTGTGLGANDKLYNHAIEIRVYK